MIWPEIEHEPLRREPLKRSLLVHIKLLSLNVQFNTASAMQHANHVAELRYFNNPQNLQMFEIMLTLG